MRGVSLLFVLLFVMPHEGHAHEDYHPKSLDLSFDEMGFDLHISYRVPKGAQAQQMRQDMDLDRDGRLDGKEQLKLQRRLVAFATFGLKVRTGEQRVMSEIDEFRVIGGDAPVRSGKKLELRVKSRYRIPWTHQEQSLELQDYLPIRKNLIHGTCSSGRVNVQNCHDFTVREGLFFLSNVRLFRPDEVERKKQDVSAP